MKISRISIVGAMAIGLAFMLVGLPGLAFAQTITIDNDIPQGTLGHWSVVVESGGESRLAFITAERMTSEDIFTENVLFDYYSYVDIGPQGEAFQLSEKAETTPEADIYDPDTVSSRGSFTGANGNTINWEVTSSIPDGGSVMTNVFTFSTPDESPLGKLRFLQYMDEDVEDFSDDVFYAKGTVVGRNLELFTMDNLEVYGVSHSGAFDEGLQNAVFKGWAADVYNNMKPQITGSGQPVTPEGIINNLSTFNHPKLGTVLGPADIVSVLAWDVNPQDSTAVIITTLGGVPDIESALEPPDITPPGARIIITDGGLPVIIDPDLPTIVLTHGLQSENGSFLDLWTGFGAENKAGSLLQNILNSSVNVIPFIWDEANQVNYFPDKEEYKEARQNVYDAGENLAKELLEYLGTGYSKRIHFIGHSLGTAVNAYAARRFFNGAPGVTKAQFTILDYPNRIKKIGWTEQFKDIFGFDSNFFASVLPIFRDDLDLKIDNYFSSPDVVSLTGVGDIANGPIYNHRPKPDFNPSGLVNLSVVGEAFFKNEAILGYYFDHIGVHQWYRWTISPNDPDTFPDPDEDTVCDGKELAEGFGFLNSLNPCQQGWAWAINNPSPEKVPFPKNNGTPIVISTSTVLDLENYVSFGCQIEIPGASPTLNCLEASSPFGVAEVDIPEDAEYLSFEYQFVTVGDGDYAAVLLDDLPIWVLSGLSSAPGEFIDSGPIPIKGLTGFRKLTIALYGVGEPNAEFEIRNFSYFSVSEVAAVPGDLNGDGNIDFSDYQILRSAFGQCVDAAGFIPEADYDEDGCITYADYRTWYGYYRNQ